MRDTKKLLACITTAVLIATASACNSGPPPSTTEQAPVAESTVEDLPVTETAQVNDMEGSDTDGESRILIAYFAVAENSAVDAVSSASVVTMDGEAKGKIRALAETIQDNMGGDLYSIRTSVAYPGNIMELIDHAAEEQAADERPDLTTQVENLQDYDIIFLGYPNWWYDLPMVMYSFLEEYDLSGKTIIPFNTHNGSRFSGTIETIQRLQPDATLLEGYSVHENSLDEVVNEVPEWLRGIGLL